MESVKSETFDHWYKKVWPKREIIDDIGEAEIFVSKIIRECLIISWIEQIHLEVVIRRSIKLFRCEALLYL